MRKLAYMAAIALAFGVLAGLPSAAQALTFDDSYDLGSVTPPEPASPSEEEGYVNNLIGLVQGSGLTTIDGHDYFRKNTSCGTCPAAVFNSRVTKEQGFTFDGNGNVVVDLGTGGFTYLIGKYDGPNGGTEVWNVQGLTGTVTIPAFGFSQPYGLSHWTLFGPGGVPDGGTTVMLLGAALGALGMARRYIMS